MDPVHDYLVTFERLRARKRWSTNTVTFRFVALTLGAAGAPIAYDSLEATATDLRERARRYSPLKSELRYVVAAMLLRRQLEPIAIHTCVMETRDTFRTSRIPWRGPGLTLAALLLALQHEGHPVPSRVFARIAAIYQRWRRDRVWLTNAIDLPMAALHISRDEDVESLTADIARAYGHLRTAGFRQGNALQRVSHLLAADPRGTDTGVQRFGLVAARLRNAGERTRPDRYDEMALLALTGETPVLVVERTLDYRARLREASSRLTGQVAFSLAAGMALAADNRVIADDQTGDLAALQSLQTIFGRPAGSYRSILRIPLVQPDPLVRMTSSRNRQAGSCALGRTCGGPACRGHRRPASYSVILHKRRIQRS